MYPRRDHCSRRYLRSRGRLFLLGEVGIHIIVKRQLLLRKGGLLRCRFADPPPLPAAGSCLAPRNGTRDELES